MLGLASDIFLGPGTLAAGVVALVLSFAARRFLSSGRSERYALPVGLAVAFFIGNLVTFPSWRTLAPEQSWQWLPYVGIVAAISAVLPFRPAVARCLVLIGASIAGGGLLTPRWPVFGLSWPTSMFVLIGYVLLAMALFELWPPRRRVSFMVGLLALDAAIVAAAVGAEVSIVYGQLAAIAAAGLAGCWASTLTAPQPSELSFRGLAPVYAVLVGGIAFTACVEPEKPLVWLFLLPLLPLVACPFARRTIG